MVWLTNLSWTTLTINVLLLSLSLHIDDRKLGVAQMDWKIRWAGKGRGIENIFQIFDYIYISISITIYFKYIYTYLYIYIISCAPPLNPPLHFYDHYKQSCMKMHLMLPPDPAIRDSVPQLSPYDWEPFYLPYDEPPLVIEWEGHTCSFLLNTKPLWHWG